MIYAYITGGGTKWIYDSLKKGGASKWFLGARVPYNQKDFDEILGGEPFDGKYVSERTAAQLSVAAWDQANKLAGDKFYHLTGLGVTAKLKTKGQRKGRENKIVLALTENGYRTFTQEYSLPSWMSRGVQEWLCSYYINQFCNTRDYSKCYDSRGLLTLDELKYTDSGIIVYSGSFNPIHDSHLAILEESVKVFNYHRVILEITTNNFSKGKSGPYELYHRKKSINDTCRYEVRFSNHSTFVEKARALKDRGFTGIVFPMGDDTYERITNEEKDDLVKLGVSIFLFKRKYNDFMDEHPVIHEFSKNNPSIPSISSTEIRKNAIQ